MSRGTWASKRFLCEVSNKIEAVYSLNFMDWTYALQDLMWSTSSWCCALRADATIQTPADYTPIWAQRFYHRASMNPKSAAHRSWFATKCHDLQAGDFVTNRSAPVWPSKESCSVCSRIQLSWRQQSIRCWTKQKLDSEYVPNKSIYFDRNTYCTCERDCLDYVVRWHRATLCRRLNRWRPNVAPSGSVGVKVTPWWLPRPLCEQSVSTSLKSACNISVKSVTVFWMWIKAIGVA